MLEFRENIILSNSSLNPCHLSEYHCVARNIVGEVRFTTRVARAGQNNEDGAGEIIEMECEDENSGNQTFVIMWTYLLLLPLIMLI